MNLRSVILGFALAAFIALATYFNDYVVSQTHFVGNHLPISVFGIVLLLMLLANPLIGLFGVKLTLKPRELAIIAVLGLVVCPWPGSNYFRTFFSTVTVPIHQYSNQTAWQSAQAMSYLPGGSAKVPAGHVRDWSALRDTFQGAMDDPQGPLQAHLAATMTEADRVLAPQLFQSDGLQEAGNKRRLLEILNRTTIEPTTLTRGQGLIATMGEGDLPPPALEDLADRDEALAEVEALQEELARHQARQTEVEAEHGRERRRLQAEASALTAELVELRGRSEQPGDAVDEADSHALSDRMAELEAERARVNVALEAVQQHFEPVRQDILRTERQIRFHRQRAVIAEQHANRAAVVATAPQIDRDGEAVSIIMPAPEGGGVLLNDGYADVFSVEVIRSGTGKANAMGIGELPWWAWRGPILTWSSIAILMTLALLFMSMIVHPQWSRRELLSYPIVRFMEEVSERPDNKSLPSIMVSRLFWVGFLLALSIHFMNGMNTWFGEPIPKLPLSFDFNGLKELFPTMGKVGGIHMLWHPRLYLSAIGFAYFLNKEVSLSVGVSVLFWGILGAIMLGNGLPVENNWASAEMGPMLRFGAYLGLAAIILYIGRSYYLNVAASMIGLPRGKATPAYATWAARGMVVCCLAVGFLLNHMLNLDWVLASLFIICILVMSLGLARINAETGMFFIQTWWLPAGVIVGLLGASATGPEGFLPLAIAGAILIQDPREAAAPFFVNALNLGERVGKASPRATVSPIVVVLIGGFALAFAATFYLQHIHGTAYHDGWADVVASKPFDELVKQVDQLESQGQLAVSNDRRGWDRLMHMDFDAETYGWLGLGAGLVIVFSLARLRLNWWPLHPIIFLIWGTYPAQQIWFSFLLGWLIKVSVTKFGGAKAFRTALPLMVGLIAGEILAAIGWVIAGAIAFGLDAQMASSIRILPG